MAKKVYYDFTGHRIGDKVVVSAAFKWHLSRYPKDHIIAIDDPHCHGSRQATLPSSVIFHGLIDEVASKPPNGAAPLALGNLWIRTPWLARQGFYPSIVLDDAVEEAIIEQFKWIKQPYVCVHILQDAPYNRCRNHSYADMKEVILRLGRVGIRVVRIGRNFNNPIIRCTDLTQQRLTVMQSACVIKNCKVFIGGDTGMSHIASAVGVPHIIGIYGPCDVNPWRYEAKQMGCDVEFNSLPSVPPGRLTSITTVSYTHLTLPTKRIV